MTHLSYSTLDCSPVSATSLNGKCRSVNIIILDFRAQFLKFWYIYIYKSVTDDGDDACDWSVSENLTLLLQNTTCPVLANSVDPEQLEKPTDLDLHGLSFNMWISIKNPDHVIWLAGN